MSQNSDGNRMLRMGSEARFIRWTHTRDGWIPETLRGQYICTTPQGWEVLIDGEFRYLPEDVWSVYQD